MIGGYAMFDWLGDLIGGVFGPIGDAITSAVWDTMLNWIYSQIFGALSEFFAYLNGMGTALFELAWVKGTVMLFLYFAWGLFVCGVIVAVFDLAIEYQNGRANIKDLALNIFKGFMAVSLVTVVPIELYKFCITLQNTFSHDLVSIFAGNNQNAGSVATLAGSVLTGNFVLPSLFSLLLMIAFGYCIIKIFFANIKRGGILLVQIAVGSLYMFSVPRGYTDGFVGWCKQVIGLCLTAFLQTTLLFLGLLTWQTDFILAIGVMLAANEVPRIAQNFGLETSSRANLMGAVYATQSALNITKNIGKAVAK
jgi:hypothetical protein